MASDTSIPKDDQLNMSLEDVSFCSVVPAWMATIDGGATPMKVPQKNGPNGTSITGEVILMNQFGKKGVMRRNII